MTYKITLVIKGKVSVAQCFVLKIIMIMFIIEESKNFFDFDDSIEMWWTGACHACRVLCELTLACWSSLTWLPTQRPPFPLPPLAAARLCRNLLGDTELCQCRCREQEPRIRLNEDDSFFLFPHCLRKGLLSETYVWQTKQILIKSQLHCHQVVFSHVWKHDTLSAVNMHRMSDKWARLDYKHSRRFAYYTVSNGNTADVLP